MTNPMSKAECDRVALILRLGLGAVFVVGGWWKLSRAINPDSAPSLVEGYMAPSGYINVFFADFLFRGPVGSWLDPLTFLTALSGFELLAGIALIGGLFVRSLSFVFAFLLWSFVIALPVVTAAGTNLDGVTHLAPAILVQIRDIGISGLFFVLFALGSGVYSLDRRLFDRGGTPDNIDWDCYGLLVRLSVAIVFLIGGIFAGFENIKSFIAAPLVLAGIGALLLSGHFVRVGAAAAMALLLWYCTTKIDIDATVWNNLNAVKRELAYIAATAILLRWGGGFAFRLSGLILEPISTLLGRRS